MSVKHTIRTKDGGRRDVVITPLRAIRLYCLECCGWQVREVRLCVANECPLWPYRMGRRPTMPQDPEKPTEAAVLPGGSAAPG